ncbi:MAG: protein kinase [Sandaracinaceae bacterium]
MPQRSAPPPPARLGRYRIVRRLGAGGMAEVFLARATGAEGIEKLLVLKRVLPTFARHPRFLGMFVDEAKVAMRLNHPNIVQMYAFEQVRDEFLLAMEHVDGLDLGRLVGASRRAGRRIGPGLAAFVVMEVARGLDYAHNRRDESGAPLDIVHRDISPQNILVSYEGAVKIADFGIARAALVSEESGVIKGKFSYMSPEQARGLPVDRRSDVYALGIVLAELLMNRSMYPGERGVELLERVRAGELTRPREVDPAVPPVLDDLVARATALRPEDRFATARELATELSRWLHRRWSISDGAELEAFVDAVAPREGTSPEGAAAPGSSPSRGSGEAPRDLRERRNVLVVHGRLRGAADGPPILGAPGDGGPMRGAAALRVLEDIAYKYDAILAWPGTGHQDVRFVIGLGRPSVDDPLHAARLALDLLDALAGLSADQPMPLRGSIGVSRGLVAVSRRAGRPKVEPVGDAFEVAQALAEAGEEGEVRVSREVQRLARRAFAFEPEGQDGSAHRLLGAQRRSDPALVGAAPPSGFVGRDDELEAVVRLYEEVLATGRSDYLALVGDLGVGKTALVAEALRRLAPRPRVVRVDCLFGGAHEPYAATRELVRATLGIRDEGDAGAVPEAVRRGLASLLPEGQRAEVEAVLVRLWEGDRQAVDRGPDRSLPLARALRILLRAVARTGPVVVWVDSVQLADLPSLELVARLTRRHHDAPLLLILGSRPDERVDLRLDSIPRLVLEELPPRDRQALVRARFGGAEVPAEVTEALVQRAGGNAFFLNELIDTLTERGALRVDPRGDGPGVVVRTGSPFTLPTTLEDVVEARLAELPEAERRALRWLAVAGGALRPADLEQAAGEPLGPSLDALEGRGLVLRRERGEVGFASPLVRLAAYDSVHAADRASMHVAVAQVLRAVGASPARLAFQLEQGGDRAGAAAAYLAAARAAEGIALDDALRFYASALDLGLSPDLAFHAHEAREELLRRRGRRAEQVDELDALDRLAAAGDPAVRAVASLRRARFALDEGRLAGVDELLQAGLEAARASGQREAEVEAHSLRGQLWRDRGEPARALEALEAALEGAARLPPLWSARASALVQKATLLWRSGGTEAALRHAAEALAIARRRRLPSIEAGALNALGVILAQAGEFEDAIRVVCASIALDRRSGDRHHLGRKVSNVGQLYGELGHPERALAFLDRALEVFEAVDDQAGRCDALCAVAEVLAAQGAVPERADEIVEEAERLATRLDDRSDLARVGLVRAELALRRGRRQEALEAARRAEERARAAGSLGFDVLARALQACALARCGRWDDAEAVATALRAETAGRRDLGRAERVHLEVARVLAGCGRCGEARDALAEAQAVVAERLERIRDPELRASYAASATVSAVRGERLQAPS